MDYKVKDICKPVMVENVRINGKIGELMDTFFYERVLSDYAKNTIYQETEDAFRNQLDDRTAVGIWQGEFWGKWIISAARVCRYTHKEELKEFIGQAANNLISLQREDGYIGTYKDSANVFAPDAETAIRLIGYPSRWNWNIWCRKYTLWGLTEAYALTGEKQILNSAVRLADQLLGELKEKNIDIWKTGTFSGLPSCSIMKPLLLLYHYVQKEEYLEFCKKIADYWEQPDAPGLIYNSINMTKIDDWYADSTSWAKTYECLSCFDGLLELYRVTGEKKYLEATECFYELMEESEKNLLFSVGYNDQFHHAAQEINTLTEPCDVIHYMRVCFELFKLTGNVKYMDSIELIYYNAFLASPCKDGKWGARTVNGSGSHGYAFNQANMKYSHCCVNNLPRGFLNAAECAVMAGEKEVYINMYHAYEAQIEVGNTVVTVHTDGDYVADSCADIHVSFQGEPVDIVLRIPSWSNKNSVTVGGKQESVSKGLFRITPSDRETNIRVEFDNTPYVKMFGSEVPKHSKEDWEYRRWAAPEAYEKLAGRVFLETPRCVIQKGAVLLCRSKSIGNTASEMFDGIELIDESYSVSLEKCSTDADVMACYQAYISNGKKEMVTKVCDYASAANMIQADTEYFSIYF